MNFSQLPTQLDQIESANWQTYKPFYNDLLTRSLDQNNLENWLNDWSRLEALINEAGTVIHIEKSLDTQSEEKEEAFLDFVSHVQPKATSASQQLKKRLLTLDAPDGKIENFKIVLRNMRNQADLFEQENVPLLTELSKLGNEYDKITGGLTDVWEGEEKNLSQLHAYLQEKDRSVREETWKIISGLWLGQRERLNTLYVQMLNLRAELAQNAGLKDFREFAFRKYDRFDYSEVDCLSFHKAIENVIVPAAGRIFSKRCQRLGLANIRPWDTEVDTTGSTRLKPYSGQSELERGGLQILHSVDNNLARYFEIMIEEGLLDLDTRAGKALGGYCATLPLRKRPFIFMNGIGTHDDVQTLLHEAGHAFHVFETASLPYIWQQEPPMEFAEVASMSMELMAGPYLDFKQGGFYSAKEAARAQIEHLEGILLFLPYMSVVDSFQHWVYSNSQLACDPAKCDKKWAELWRRFIPGIDYSGFEDEMETGWHRKLHIFHVPFYYIEYGFAQIGALQLWRNAQQDRETSLSAYREALSLGGTKTLPELFETAGIEFRFDEDMLAGLVKLLEKEIEKLETFLEL